MNSTDHEGGASPYRQPPAEIPFGQVPAIYPPVIFPPPSAHPPVYAPYLPTPYPPAPYPPTPYPPVPPPPPRRRRTGLVTILVVVGVLVVASCAGGLAALGRVQHNAGPAQPGPRIVGEPLASPTGSTYDGKMTYLLLPPPAGARSYRNPASYDGRLTLDQAAALYAGPDSIRARLDAAGFDRGAIGLWRATDGTVVEIQLFQFKSTVDAERWAALEIGLTRVDPAYADPDVDPTYILPSYGDASPIGGIAGGAFYAGTVADRDGFFAALMVAAKGGIVETISVKQRHRVDQAFCADLATRQFQLLP